MKVYFVFALFLFGTIVLNANGDWQRPMQDGSQLLMGTLVKQAPTKEEALRGIRPIRNLEEVKVKILMW